VEPAPTTPNTIVVWGKASDRLFALTCQDALRFKLQSWQAEALAANGYALADELWAEPDVDRVVERAQCRAHEAPLVSPADDRLALPVRVPLGEGRFDDAILLLDPAAGDGDVIAGAKPPFAFSPEGRFVVAASTSDSPGVVITDTETLERREVALAAAMTGVVFASGDRAVVTLLPDGQGDGDTDSGTNVAHGRTEVIELATGERLSLPRWVGRSPDAVIGGRVWYIGDWAGARVLVAANLATGAAVPIEIDGEPDAVAVSPSGEEVAVLVRRTVETKQAPVLAFFDANGRLLREVDLPVDPELW